MRRQGTGKDVEAVERRVVEPVAQLTDQQIAQHVAGGGFVGDERVIGVAIVLAESRGRTDAIGDVGLQTDKWGPSVGLFQIRSLHADKGTGRTRDELANLDAATNARHARQIFLEAGGRFNPWSTFIHGTHRQFLSRARNAVGPGVAGPGVGDTVHVIQQGETLGRIAAAHGLTLAQLKALNPGLFDAAHHGGDLVHPGEVVILSSAGPVAAFTPGAPTHAIRRGETLSGIAHAHGLTLQHLQALNPSLFDAAHRGGDLIHPDEVVFL